MIASGAIPKNNIVNRTESLLIMLIILNPPNNLPYSA